MSNNQTIPQIKSLTQVKANSNQNPAGRRGNGKQWKKSGLATELGGKGRWEWPPSRRENGDQARWIRATRGREWRAAGAVEQGKNMKADGLGKEMGFYMGGKGSKYENLLGV